MGSNLITENKKLTNQQEINCPTLSNTPNERIVTRLSGNARKQIVARHRTAELPICQKE